MPVLLLEGAQVLSAYFNIGLLGLEYFDILDQPFIFIYVPPVQGETATDMHVRGQVVLVYHDLLSLHIVGDEGILVYPSGYEPSASHLRRSTGYKHKQQFLALDIDTELSDEALHNRYGPSLLTSF